MIDSGIDVNCRTKKGRSALLQAALRRREVKIFKLLLEGGADPN